MKILEYYERVYNLEIIELSHVTYVMQYLIYFNVANIITRNRNLPNIRYKAFTVDVNMEFRTISSNIGGLL